jgi:hypothetical protein
MQKAQVSRESSAHWIPACAGMTARPRHSVIPAQAGIQNFRPNLIFLHNKKKYYNLMLFVKKLINLSAGLW